jgi:phosphatidylglycerophosphate synthase
MARFTIAQIIASLPPEKNRADSPVTQYVYRPLSFAAAWVFLSLGWSPNAVTYLSALLCLAGFGFLASGPLWAAWVGIACFFLFAVLDCADGNMARVLKRESPWGEWVDAFGGYIAYTTILLGAGAAAQSLSNGTLPGIPGAILPWPGGWTLVGGVAASANLFMRTIYQGHRAITPDPGRASVGAEKNLSENLGITGVLLPALGLGLAFGFLPWVLMAYAVFYCGGCLLVAVKLIRRVETEIRQGRKRVR